MNTNPNKKHTETQKQQILEWLLLGLSLTPWEAIKYFGCTKLATRCSEFIREGWPIKKEWVTVNSGKKVKTYKL